MTNPIFMTDQELQPAIQWELDRQGKQLLLFTILEGFKEAEGETSLVMENLEELDGAIRQGRLSTVRELTEAIYSVIYGGGYDRAKEDIYK